MLDEREACSEEVRRTRYITNPNYVYEPFGSGDSDGIIQDKINKEFWEIEIVCVRTILFKV